LKTYEKIGSGTILVTDGALKYIQFDCLNKYSDILIHFMSTRAGGVSSGECSTLNLSFSRNDSRENVLNNYRLLCASAGVETESLVLAEQVHGTRVYKADAADKGKGFLRKSDIYETDGLMTTVPGITMATLHADCVPIFLFEPGIKAAALLHSGWKGTLLNIVSSALTELKKLPGFDPKRLVAVIGPSIGRCCFEVDEDVYALFREKYDDSGFYGSMPQKKWNIDLKGIIKRELTKEGLDDSSIYDSGLCTKCRKDLFFSYRGDMGKTGSMAAFMQIRP